MRIISQSAQFLPQLFILPACVREREWLVLVVMRMRAYARPPYSLDSGHKTYCARYGASEEEEKAASKQAHSLRV